MITKYDIKFENNNIVLIVNLDFFYEFSNFDYKEYSKNLKNEIIKIAKNNGANKIKIIIGGVLLSTLILTPVSNIDDSLTTFITKNTIKESLNEIDIEDDVIIIDVSKPKEDIENNKEIHNIININKNENKIKNEESTNHSVSNNNKETIEKNNESPNKENINNINEKNDKDKINNIEGTKNQENSIENKVIDNNIYVTIYRSNGTILKLELEEYLIGVVGSEMPASFNIEALKAQAIVARTYALKSINTGKKLTDTVSTQVYKDNNELKNMWGGEFDKYYNKIKNAVINTKSVVLMYNNNYIDAVYHSTSNGKTEDAIYVWGNNIPYLKVVDSKTDLNATSYKREVTFLYEKISNILNTTIDKNTNFILERNTSGRVSNVKVNDIEIKGTTFRSLLGLRSTDFSIELADENVIITTFGYGHGVGMSQYGANGMANLGYSYEQILKHYYQGVTLKNI